ncbi:PAS domain-containing protein [Brevifollis gellanilyticus]|uniref:histidine kinase n=1 Tax=Brevifollis gellanilyticus TaxID=748831 RepID=A0A512M2I3_9BACT|nr:PAS domain-containing protein [Brevifollis gellanilyticus]GEP40946.1 hypothetical protein BGE01nite_02370 [Brevifollis gellanilyticus]
MPLADSLHEMRAANVSHSEAETLSFLNRLTQAVLGRSSPEEIIGIVEKMLGEHLGVSRVLVAEASPDGETVSVPQTWETEGMPKLQATTHRLSDYGERLLADYRLGRTHVRRDASAEYPAGAELNALTEIGALAAIDVPVLIEGKFCMLFVVHQCGARDWTQGEISLVQQVADRTAAEVRRARALREVQASELRFRQMADSMPQIVWTAGADGVIDYYNGKWLEYTGLPSELAARQPGHELPFHKEDVLRMSEAWERALMTGKQFEHEVRLRRGHDGSYRWFINRGLPVSDAGGSGSRWYGTLTDIHDQKMLAEASFRNEARLGSALTLADMGTFDWDMLSDQVTMDIHSRELFGFDAEQPISSTDVFGRIVPSMMQTVRDEVTKVLQKRRQRLEVEYDVCHPNGEIRTVISMGNIAMGADGMPERIYGVFGDVTNRRQVAKEREQFIRTIETEKANLAAVVEQAPAFICILRGPDHIFELANDGYYRLVGRRNLIGLRVREALPEVVGQGFFEMLDEVYSTGRPISGTEVPALLGPEHLGDDRQRFVNFVYQALRAPDGNINGVFVHGVDVTEAVLAREAIVTSERQRKAALDAAGIGAFNIDLRTLALESDERFRAIFGVADDILSYEQAFAIIHPDDRQLVRNKVAAAIDPLDPQPYACEYRVVHADGSVHWVTARGRAAYEGHGTDRHLASFDGTVIDITGKKKAEDELAFQRHQLELIFRESPAAMALWRGDDLIFERVNPEYQRWFGQRTLVGKSLLEAVPELAGQEFDEMLRQVLHSGNPFTGTEMLARFTREGTDSVEDRYFDFTYLQVCDPEGHPYGVYDHAVDVTSRVLARQALEKSQALLEQALSDRQSLLDAERAARMEAEQASRMKDEFLATLSHELRTPLNAIVGWTQLLQMIPDPSGELTEGLEIISRNARAQTQIIEDILDMSRIVSGKLRLTIRAVNLTEIVRVAVDTLQPAANGKGVQLHFEAAKVTESFPGDPNRLQQVFWNLLSNAVKFTPKGGKVHVGVRTMGGNIEVCVTDNGQGIAPEFLPYVFNRFRQADASTTRVHGGLGLGLSIVRQIVEMHGGTVRVLSPGKGLGASFIISLPTHSQVSDGREQLEVASQPSGHEELGISDRSDDHPLQGIDVVVVDDEADAVAFVQRLLTAAGARVRIACSATDALTLIQTKSPDVLVSDIGMPVEDGYSLMRKVRALPSAAGGKLAAIALTAYARSIDRVKALDAGFQMHISKPVDPSELIASVAALVRAQS